MDIPDIDKAKLLTDLKAGAVNVVALKPINAVEQAAFDKVMGRLRQGASWLALVTNDKKAVFYEWPLSQRMAKDYDDLAQLLQAGLGYATLHVERLDVMGQVLKTAEVLILEKEILLLFDYSDSPGAGRIVNFFIVPMEGFIAHDPGFEKVMKKIKGESQ